MTDTALVETASQHGWSPLCCVPYGLLQDLVERSDFAEAEAAFDLDWALLPSERHPFRRMVHREKCSQTSTPHKEH